MIWDLTVVFALKIKHVQIITKTVLKNTHTGVFTVFFKVVNPASLIPIKTHEVINHILEVNSVQSTETLSATLHLTQQSKFNFILRVSHP